MGLRGTIFGKRRTGKAQGRGSTTTNEHQERTSAEKRLGALSLLLNPISKKTKSIYRAGPPKATRSSQAAQSNQIQLGRPG